MFEWIPDHARIVELLVHWAEPLAITWWGHKIFPLGLTVSIAWALMPFLLLKIINDFSISEKLWGKFFGFIHKVFSIPTIFLRYARSYIRWSLKVLGFIVAVLFYPNAAYLFAELRHIYLLNDGILDNFEPLGITFFVSLAFLGAYAHSKLTIIIWETFKKALSALDVSKLNNFLEKNVVRVSAYITLCISAGMAVLMGIKRLSTIMALMHPQSLLRYSLQLLTSNEALIEAGLWSFVFFVCLLIYIWGQSQIERVKETPFAYKLHYNIQRMKIIAKYIADK